jgi:tetraacyldisaccharide 4'-kinase
MSKEKKKKETKEEKKDAKKVESKGDKKEESKPKQKFKKVKRPPRPRGYLRFLVPLYRLGLALRALRLDLGLERVEHLKWPVISVGNLSTGGTGKTPFTIALAKLMTKRGFQVDVLSRGYGRTEIDAARVAHDGKAESFGDEPLLILREAEVPVFVASQRFEAGKIAEQQLDAERKAEKAREDRQTAALEQEVKLLEEEARSGGASEAEIEESRSLALTTTHKKTPQLIPVHLLDDGFQHRQLARAVDILLLNREDWLATLLPAGNLREPHYAAHRATVIAIPSEDRELEGAIKQWGWQGPIWKFRRVMYVDAFRDPVAAFCGIARPEQFFQGLHDQGFKVMGEYAYPDHFTYKPSILKEMVKVARLSGARALVTTEKDILRLGTMAEVVTSTMPLLTAALKIRIEEPEVVMDWLTGHLMPKQPATR